MSQDKPPSPGNALSAKVLAAALTILRDNDGEMPVAELRQRVEAVCDFTEWEAEWLEKSGIPRWLAYLNWTSVDCVKAGFLVKKSGIWYLTPEGEKSLSLDPLDLAAQAKKGYDLWKARQPKEADKVLTPSNSPTGNVTPEDDDNLAEQTPAMILDNAKGLAAEGLKAHVNAMNAYEFQDLVAALLRGMGYYTPFVAPKGKDGGVDVIAYRDPLGTSSPRIKAQVKHQQQKTSAPELHQLMGVLQKDGDVGIFIASGDFTADAKQVAKTSHIHVELIDLDHFLELWREFYPKMSDEDRNLLPLVPVYFLAETE